VVDRDVTVVEVDADPGRHYIIMIRSHITRHTPE
jgi:hypothetical protein